MRTVLVRELTALTLVALTAAACGSDDSSEATRAQIVVTTNILGDVVTNLVGDQADVDVIMPPNADPHAFAPSPQQVEAMRTADLLVINGEGFEAGLVDTIEAAEADGATVVRATDLVEARPFVEGDEAGNDPHVFTSPANMIVIAQAVADQLVEAVPALDTSAFRAQVGSSVADLTALDGEVEDILDRVPPERRRLVTNHDVFGYFADRYDFEILGAVIPSGSTLAEPSGQDLTELAATIADAEVPAIFADTSSPTRLAEALAGEGTNVEVVELFSESLGEPGSGGDTYLALMRTNAQRIAAALG